MFNMLSYTINVSWCFENSNT